MQEAKVEALLNPRNVAILGARENPSGWTARIFANLQRFGFEGGVYPVNPRHDRIWDVPCYPDLESLPEAPDHLVVMRAAAVSADALREGARLGGRSATLYAAGFSETGTEEGRHLEDELRGVIDDTGFAVSGPNCLGNLSARARLLTLPDDRVRELVAGPVAMVGQSGTTTPGIGRALMDRGIDVGYIVTSGNEIGLTTADYIAYFAADPAVRVIFCLIESVRRPDDFLAACRRAQEAGKPVVALKMGNSEGGREAALAHTGSLAGAIEAFDAVAGRAGVIRVDTADQAVNLVEFLVSASLPPVDGVGVLVYSGGVRGLSLDAAHRHGIALPAFAEETARRIRGVLGDNQRVSNPLDAAGFINISLDNMIELIAAIREDPGVGTVLLQEDLPPGEGINDANRRRAQRVLSTMEAIEQRLLADGGKPISLISATSSDVTDFARQARARFPHLACLNEPERAFATLRHAIGYRDRLARPAPAEAQAKTASPAARRFRDRLAQVAAPTPLSEPEAKDLLRAYGIPVPEENVATSPDEAVAIADRIGYPVVVKAVAPRLTHKSDAGAVALGLADAQAVREACARIAQNVADYDPDIALDGWLVAQAIADGLEIVLGIQRDPEMGPVVMFGSGGVLLELFGDVAFAGPGMTREEAEELIADTQAGRLLDGYRGGGACDREAVIEALLAVGRIAAELGHAIESMDINPLVALPEGSGVFALDALVVAGPADGT